MWWGSATLSAGEVSELLGPSGTGSVLEGMCDPTRLAVCRAALPLEPRCPSSRAAPNLYRPWTDTGVYVGVVQGYTGAHFLECATRAWQIFVESCEVSSAAATRNISDSVPGRPAVAESPVGII